MKIIILKRSILFIDLDLKADKCKCFFLFFISWNIIKDNYQDFNFNKTNMKQIKQFYVNLAYDWNRKYRL
jgi:hypothetical protein